MQGDCRKFGMRISSFPALRHLAEDLFCLPLMLLPWLLVACGGVGEGDAVSASPLLAADVPGCTRPAVHDSGHVVYVVMPRDCADAGTERDLQVGMPDAVRTPLRMRIGEESASVEIDGLGPRRVGLFRSGQWRMFANTDSWEERDGAGLLLLNGELYLLGGWLAGPVTNEVWKTSDLSNWQFLGHAPWAPRHGAAWLVHDQRLWVIGGDLIDDVWSSPDGVSWTMESSAAPFGKRYTPNAASVGGEIVVYAGQDWLPVEWCYERPDCTARGLRSVWKSRDGRTWSQATPEAPWAGRGLIHGQAMHNGEIMLIGGGLKVTPPNERYAETSAEFSDIWSSADGVNWRLRMSRFSFAPRTHFSVTSTPIGCFVSDGSIGTQNNLSSDLFHAPDCVDFAPVPDPPPMQARHASSMAYFNGTLVILGGPPYGGAGTTVWQYFP